MTTDSERRYGVPASSTSPLATPRLASPRYFHLLERHMRGSAELAEHPAGPMISMLELGETCEYWFCDLDPDSTANVGQAAVHLGLEHRAHVVHGDGVTAVDDALAGSPDVNRVVLNVDPVDWHAVGAAGLSALDLCRNAADLGAAVICWYGYDRAERRYWLLNDLRSPSHSTRRWCGDIMITRAVADLSERVTSASRHRPERASGLPAQTCLSSALQRCEQLGTALARVYDRRPLPDGRVHTADPLPSRL